MLANSVWSTGIGQSVDESKAILCPCICTAMRYQHEVKSLVAQALILHACGASCERCANASPFNTLSSCEASNLYKYTPVCKHLLTTHKRDRTYQHPPKAHKCMHILAVHCGQSLRAWVLSGCSIATCPWPCLL